MKASTLIAQLANLIEEYGDKNVRFGLYTPGLDESEFFKITEVEERDNEFTLWNA